MADRPPGTRLWLYRRPFHLGSAAGLVLLDSRTTGVFSSLWIDGDEVASDFTPATGPQSVRNHRLQTTLADGRRVEAEAGYNSWLNTGIAVRINGELVHESHPGRSIAFPERAARMMTRHNPAGEPAYDPGKIKRNKVPILVDITAGLLFFAIAKLTDLRTAALAGAAVGIALIIAQRFIRTDILGGMALFGIVMLLISASFAILFEDDEIIKQRSTIVGLIGAAFFFGDGLLLKGRRLGRGINRYLVYTDVDDRRLSIAMGAVGAVMALANFTVVRLVSTDAWLFYTTFGDVPLSIGLVLVAVKWSRRIST